MLLKHACPASLDRLGNLIDGLLIEERVVLTSKRLASKILSSSELKLDSVMQGK
jgi:hypothetical protein